MSTHQAKAPERTPLILMDRVYGASGALITQASIETLTYEVWVYSTKQDAEEDLNGTVVVEEEDLVVATTIFDALQTDAPWNVSRDEDGYNFRFTLPATARPLGRRWHRVQIWLTPTGEDEPFPLVWIIHTEPLANS